MKREQKGPEGFILPHAGCSDQRQGWRRKEGVFVRRCSIEGQGLIMCNVYTLVRSYPFLSVGRRDTAVSSLLQALVIDPKAENITVTADVVAVLWLEIYLQTLFPLDLGQSVPMSGRDKSCT